MTNERSSHTNTWAIAVVHGVGTPHPGETLTELCKGISRVRPDFLPVPSDIEHTSASDGTKLTTRSFTTDDGDVRAVEVFWGDISRTRGTIGELLRAVFLNLFGLLHICRGALRQADGFTRTIAIVPFQLARWVILPLHILSLATAVIIGLVVWLSASPNVLQTQDYLTSEQGVFLLILGVLFAIGVIAGVRRTVAGGRHFKLFAGDILVALTAFAFLSALLTLTSVQSWFRACEGLAAPPGQFEFLDYLWGIITGRPAHNVGEFVCNLLVASTPIEKTLGIGKYIAINEFVGDAAFFVSAALALVLICITIGWYFFGSQRVHQALSMCVLSVLVFVVFMAVILEPADFVTRFVQSYTSDGRYEFAAYWYESLLIGWIVLAALGGACSFAYRWFWLRSYGRWEAKGLQDDSHAEEQFPPRLIVPSFFELFVLFGSIVLIFVFLNYIQVQAHNRTWYEHPGFLILTPMVLAIVLLPFVFYSHLRFGLAVSMDLVNHFFSQGDEFPLRQKIFERFSSAIDHLVGEGNKPHLLIVAHSQGTVISLDAFLNDLWNKPFGDDHKSLSASVEKLTLLTFGSPITHLYQHYFYAEYPELAETVINELSNDPRFRWLNIYRIDDYVGTHIDGPAPDFPLNIPRQIGGHTAYWEDDVLSVLPEDCLPGIAQPKDGER